MAQLENLTEKHGVEFAVTYQHGPGRNGGGGQYYLHSGTPSSVRIPIKKDRMFIYHTHPKGTRSPSTGDRNVLKALRKVGSPQRSSELIPVGNGPVVPFKEKFER